MKPKVNVLVKVQLHHEYGSWSSTHVITSAQYANIKRNDEYIYLAETLETGTHKPQRLLATREDIVESLTEQQISEMTWEFAEDYYMVVPTESDGEIKADGERVKISVTNIQAVTSNRREHKHIGIWYQYGAEFKLETTEIFRDLTEWAPVIPNVISLSEFEEYKRSIDTFKTGSSYYLSGFRVLSYDIDLLKVTFVDDNGNEEWVTATDDTLIVLDDPVLSQAYFKVFNGQARLRSYGEQLDKAEADLKAHRAEQKAIMDKSVSAKEAELNYEAVKAKFDFERGQMIQAYDLLSGRGVDLPKFVETRSKETYEINRNPAKLIELLERFPALFTVTVNDSVAKSLIEAELLKESDFKITQSTSHVLKVSKLAKSE